MPDRVRQGFRPSRPEYLAVSDPGGRPDRKRRRARHTEPRVGERVRHSPNRATSGIGYSKTRVRLALADGFVELLNLPLRCPAHPFLDRLGRGLVGGSLAIDRLPEEDGDGETESETVRRVREKEKDRRAETVAESDTEAESDSGLPAGFLSRVVRADSDGRGPKMNGTDRRKIQGIGQLRLANDPDLARRRDELLGLKKDHDENDPNTVNKLLILWIHQGLSAGELRRIIDLAKRYGPGAPGFAYAVGLAKKRIGERLWEAY